MASSGTVNIYQGYSGIERLLPTETKEIRNLPVGGTYPGTLDSKARAGGAILNIGIVYRGTVPAKKGAFISEVDVQEGGKIINFTIMNLSSDAVNLDVTGWYSPI
ncbi:hypothetical protein CN995_01860 [Bacillus cereus]|uniref:Uncharacterized protein n=1 Tax=Bacillus cereus TaxID=1396 RepID=A0A9X7B8U0_BACCE|nr:MULTISPECIES: hypothetical protein [Bacillus cereus group]PFV02920.1 hypothetical protein COK98_25650 [Bacillus cereus]PGK66290.1 hypothetical protein CN928_25725 [Bacillus thuringiensis]PGM04090.1 hypothetical protein CN942_19940 [Bacillus thuringiensis]PGP09339.1 hypothetical protein CN995_01860 [Bacillus cereus]